MGVVVLAAIVVLCVGTLPWTLSAGSGGGGVPRYNQGELRMWGLSPWWWPGARDKEEVARLNALVEPVVVARVAAAAGISVEEAVGQTEGPVAAELRGAWPGGRVAGANKKLCFLLGTDVPNGRSLLVRCLAGGGISLGVGIAAALLAVLIGTAYGALAAYLGGMADAVMMRIVDILYGLPSILLVVLLAVASDALLDEYITRARAREGWVREHASLVVQEGGKGGGPLGRLGEPTHPGADKALRARLQEEALKQPHLQPRQVSPGARTAYDLVVLLVAIGGVSWLTMARVIRGQVLSLKAQPFMEAARAIGVPWGRQFLRHLLPNLVGPIIVYATLTVPQAILQESLLSFLGIGVKAPLPSWGTLAAEGLGQLNPYKSYWWLLLFPCLLLAGTLLALNFVGEGLRERFDPKR